MDVNFSAIFLPEATGTFLLALLGCGVVANETLPGTKGHGSGFLMVNFGWGLAVFAGVFAAVSTGGHINPAVTLGMLANGATEFADGIPATAANAAVYIVAQERADDLGGNRYCLACKRRFDADAPGAVKLGGFSTGPELRSYGGKFVTHVIGQFAEVSLV